MRTLTASLQIRLCVALTIGFAILTPTAAVYEIKESDSCSSYSGCSNVASLSECEQAASALSLSDTSADTKDSTIYVLGCLWYSSELYFNSATSTTWSCRPSEKCICSCGGSAAPTTSLAPTLPSAAPTSTPTYEVKNSGGSCSSYSGCSDVASLSECEQAASALSFSDTSAEAIDSSTYALGCVCGGVWSESGVTAAWSSQVVFGGEGAVRVTEPARELCTQWWCVE
ncbi:hypothetical protein CYMTET_56121 [Cymbomonas tetramitiformis]|uniref:Uncharacterized protein n=1 Tax=Cymbomonas tetramitiformis TaxID=36881 RepID=A0AAE0BBX9_9CHLO|nr:hypothetical protein CYMTET_56121 [Cymbomonas tetramitiformis]